MKIFGNVEVNKGYRVKMIKNGRFEGFGWGRSIIFGGIVVFFYKFLSIN